MLRRVLPFLKRPDIEFTLECTSFFCSVWQFCIGSRSFNRVRMTHDLPPSPRNVPHSQNLLNGLHVPPCCIPPKGR
jgi:hypothetical protein